MRITPRPRPVELSASRPDPSDAFWPDVTSGFAPGETWDGWTKTRPEEQSDPLLIEHGEGADRAGRRSGW